MGKKISVEQVRLQMVIASIWMTVTGERFVDITADPHGQLECIEKAIVGYKDRMYGLEHDMRNADDTIIRLEDRILDLERAAAIWGQTP